MFVNFHREEAGDCVANLLLSKENEVLEIEPNQFAHVFNRKSPDDDDDLTTIGLEVWLNEIYANLLLYS